MIISKVKTGVFPEDYRELYGIKERHFDALDKLIGTGAYSHIKMMWGEWSSFKGKRDVFLIDFEELPMEDKSTVEVSFPPFLAQGKIVEIKPIIFKWKRGVTLACFQ